MTIHTVVLEQDTTGLLSTNLIQNEQHAPPAAAHRLIIPKWGAFFADATFIIKDADTNQVVAPDKYILGDTWGYASELSGKDVRTCLTLKATAPVGVSITYQAFGGPQSRNAQAIVDWLQEHITANNASLPFSELKDLPERFEPAFHLHLFAHIYGMEYIVDALTRVKLATHAQRANQIEVDYATVLNKLERMKTSVDTTVNALVSTAWDNWKKNFSLYALGLDLLKNYPALGASGAYSASPEFYTVNATDERYVDLKGLGTFSKAFVDRLVSFETGIGVDLAMQREAQRGSFVGAAIGEVFYLPSPKVARALDYTNMSVYPTGWPETHAMTVVKQMANFDNYGGVFSAYDQVNGNQFVGIMANDTWKTPLVWQRVYHEDETTAIATALQVHVAGRQAAHDETKAQLRLGKVENLPVVSEDYIVTDEPIRKYVTYDVLMAFVRARMEKIHLARKANGEVDYTADLVNKTKVIINSGAKPQDHPAKDQFLSSFCDGTDKYVRYTDGMGSFYDKMVAEKSADCKFVVYPAYGTQVAQSCDNHDLKTRYSDGAGGYFTEITKVDSPECGYNTPLPLGTVVSVFCSGVNQKTRYADGNGGVYDMTTMVNTYLCGGTIYPTKTTGGDTGGEPTTKALTFASDKSKLSTGTVEKLTFKATGFTATHYYTFELMMKSPSANGGAEKSIFRDTFQADATGAYNWSQTRTDDGVSTARGTYDTWIRVASDNLDSNIVVRDFITGIGVSVTPDPTYNPKIVLDTDKTDIYVGTNETITYTLTGFDKNTTYTAEGWVSKTETTKMLTVDIPTGPDGSALYQLVRYDDGVVPRGIYDCWVEINIPASTAHPTAQTIKSNHKLRNFKDGLPPGGGTLELKCSISNSLFYLTNAITHTVVLTGAEKSKQYTIELYRSTSSDKILTAGTMIRSALLTTDGAGTTRLDYNYAYDGTNPAPGTYIFYAKITGLAQTSNTATATFVNKTEPAKGDKTISVVTDKPIIFDGETQTVTTNITNFSPNTLYVMQFFANTPSYNGGKDFMVTTVDVRTGPDGAGTHVEISTVAVDAYHADFQYWAVIPSDSVKSAPITISVRAPAITNPPVSDIKVNLSSNLSTIKKGDIETITITATGLGKTKEYAVTGFVTSPALQNGNTPIQTMNKVATTNSLGELNLSFTNAADDGVTVPRGTYTCWAVIANVSSPPIYRTFITTTPTYTPVLVFYCNPLTASIGTSMTNVVTISGAEPNKAYSVDVYASSPAANSNIPGKVISGTLLTNGSGGASWTYPGYDDGIIPRGEYKIWANIPSLPLRSSDVIVKFIGAPAVTDPPYNPAFNFYANIYDIQIGQTVTLTLAMSGMKPNTTYSTQVWWSQREINSGTAFNSHTLVVTTDASGYGVGSYSYTHNGVIVPAGTGTLRVYDPTSGVTSSAFQLTLHGTTQPPVTEPPYNPVASYSLSHYDIHLATPLKYYLTLTGMKPYTSYKFDIWMSHPMITYGAAFKTDVYFTVYTDANGYATGTLSFGPAEIGLAPAGNATMWTNCSGVNVSSNAVGAYFYGN